MLSSVSQQQLEARLTSAIKALGDSISSEPEFAAMEAPTADRRRSLQTLNPIFTAIQIAEQNLAQRNIPDGILATMWRGASNAFTDPVAQTAGSVLPGIGNLVAGLWSGVRLSKQDDEAINAFRKSIETFRVQMDGVFAKCYEEITEGMRRQGVTFGASEVMMAATFKRLDRLCDGLESVTSLDEKTRVLSEIRRFVDEFPFSSRGHCMCAFALIGLDRFEEAEREAYEAYSLDKKNDLAMALLLVTRLEQHRWDDAAATAAFALESLRADPSLCIAVAYSLKIVPSPALFYDCMSFVASNLLNDGHPLGYILQARIEASAARNEECRLMLSKFLMAGPLEMEDVVFLRNDQVLSGVVKSAFAGVLSGRPDHTCIAKSVIPCDTVCFGFIPTVKQTAAITSFVKLLARERLICYCDTTLFGGGDDGFALTDFRILWHELWGSPCAVNYSEIKDFEFVPSADRSAVLKIHRQHDTMIYSQAPAGGALGLFNYLILLFAAGD